MPQSWSSFNGDAQTGDSIIGRLNANLLQNENIDQQIRGDLQSFFEINETPDVSPVTLWGAHKAFIRGLYVKYSARLKKERLKESLDTLAQIADLEAKNKKKMQKEDLLNLKILRENT